MNWRDYWNQDTPIYVSDRHKVLHYWLIANDIASLIPSPDAVVLDHGCGEALSANRVAARCAQALSPRRRAPGARAAAASASATRRGSP